jgi:hypothetical protein
MLSSHRLEHKGVLVSAKGFEVMELMTGVGISTAQPYKVFMGDTVARR